MFLNDSPLFASSTLDGIGGAKGNQTGDSEGLVVLGACRSKAFEGDRFEVEAEMLDEEVEDWRKR